MAHHPALLSSHHGMLTSVVLPVSTSPYSQRDWAKRPWAEAPETTSQMKSLLPETLPLWCVTAVNV